MSENHEIIDEREEFNSQIEGQSSFKNKLDDQKTNQTYEIPTTKKPQNQYNQNLSPLSRSPRQNYHTDQNFESYSPSKGVFQYYNEQNKLLEGRLEQKEREIAEYRAQLATQKKTSETVDKENNRLRLSINEQRQDIDGLVEENNNLSINLQNTKFEVEKSHKIILELEEQIQRLQKNLDDEHKLRLLTQEKQKQSERDSQNHITHIENENLRRIQEIEFEKDKQIRLLNSEIQRLEDKLKREQLSHQETISQLKQTQLERSQEELEKRRTLEQLDLQIRLNDELQRKNSQDNLIKDNLHEDKIKNLIALHSFEKEKLLKEISLLNSVANSKTKEAQIERINNHKLSMTIQERDNILRNESAEKEFFRQKLEHAERQRSIEQNLNHSNIQTLKQSYHQEILQKEIEKEQLQKQLINKEVEVQHQRQITSKTLTEKQQIEREKKRKEIEAEYHRLKAQEIERKKNLELTIKEELHLKERRGLERSYSAEKELLIGQVHNLSNQVFQKQREAENWRTNFTIEQQRERQLSAEKELLARQVNNLSREVVIRTNEAQNWRTSFAIEQQRERQLSAEKELLAAQNRSLNQTLVMKATEADGWKRNFLIEKEQERRLENQKALLTAQNQHLNHKYIQKTIEATGWKNQYIRESLSPARRRY